MLKVHPKLFLENTLPQELETGGSIDCNIVFLFPIFPLFIHFSCHYFSMIFVEFSLNFSYFWTIFRLIVNTVLVTNPEPLECLRCSPKLGPAGDTSVDYCYGLAFRLVFFLNIIINYFCAVSMKNL